MASGDEKLEGKSGTQRGIGISTIVRYRQNLTTRFLNIER